MVLRGLVRKTDKLGRFVIPSEIWEILEMKPGDFLEVFEEGKKIILKNMTHHVSFTVKLKK